MGDCLSFELGDAAAEIFGVINQRPYLFNTTIANNLRLDNEEASDEQLRDALVRVGLWEMIDQLPQKMATPVAEAGLRFLAVSGIDSRWPGFCCTTRRSFCWMSQRLVWIPLRSGR